MNAGVTSAVTARRVAAELLPDPARVIAQLFLPGEELPHTRSRASQIVARVMSLDDMQVDRLAAQLLSDFSSRHPDYEQLLERHAGIVAAHVGAEVDLSTSRRLVIGASFTSEYATEAAALCNPSAVRHPDQNGLAQGAVRAAISLRGIGEGHRSTIGFCSAVVGPGQNWEFEPRALPATVGVASAGQWSRRHFRTVLVDQGQLDEVSRLVVSGLPTTFGSLDLERVLGALPRDLLIRSGTAHTVERLRSMVASAYDVDFAAGAELSQRVLVAVAAEESNGVEDARFTRFVNDDETVEYRATYTAYDGERITPRILTSPDLQRFEAHRISGPAARNKGMALFPRTVQGRHLALCRSDGESTMLASSPDGFSWSEPELLQPPQSSWELLQVGNCGPPIETEHGWLVLTHGVGPMRRYSIGAILLDLDDPSRVLGHLDDPLLSPAADERDGYVPNVVYSCGGLVNDGLLWLPFGIDDARIGVANVALDELLDALQD